MGWLMGGLYQLGPGSSLRLAFLPRRLDNPATAPSQPDQQPRASRIERPMQSPKTYRVVAVRQDGSRRILAEGETQTAAELKRLVAVTTHRFVRVMIEPEHDGTQPYPPECTSSA